MCRIGNGGGGGMEKNTLQSSGKEWFCLVFWSKEYTLTHAYMIVHHEIVKEVEKTMQTLITSDVDLARGYIQIQNIHQPHRAQKQCIDKQCCHDDSLHCFHSIRRNFRFDRLGFFLSVCVFVSRFWYYFIYVHIAIAVYLIPMCWNIACEMRFFLFVCAFFFFVSCPPFSRFPR